MGRLNFGGAIGGALEVGLTTYKTLKDVQAQDERVELEKRNQARLDEHYRKADARADEEIDWKRDERETKLADEELGVWYANVKSGKQATLSERGRKRLVQIGIDSPLGPNDPKDAVDKGRIADQLLGVIAKRKPNLEQTPAGTKLPVGELGQAFVALEPDSYSKVYSDDKGEYMVQPHTLYLSKPQGKTSFALGLQIMRKAQDGTFQPTDEIVPRTVNKTNKSDDQVSLVSLDDLQAKLQATSEFSKMYLDGVGSVENYLALKGNKQAVEARGKAKTLDSVTALASSGSFQKALKGTYGELLQSGLEMAQQGLMEGTEFAKLAQLATTKEIETKTKNQQDETEASTAVLGYAGMGKDAPRTAAMANQLAGLMKEQKISGKRASKMLELMFAAEQKAADRQTTIRAAAARGGGGDNQANKLLLGQIKQVTDDLYGTWDQQYALGNHAPAARQFAQAKAAEAVGLGRIIQPRNPERPAVYLTNEMAAALQKRYPNARSIEELLSFGAGDPQVRGALEANKLTVWHEGHFANLPQKAETVAAGREKAKAAANPYFGAGLKQQ